MVYIIWVTEIGSTPFQVGPSKGPPAWCHSSQQNKTTFSSEAKESLIFDQRMKRYKLELQSTYSCNKPLVELLYMVFINREAGEVHEGQAQRCCSGFQIRAGHSICTQPRIEGLCPLSLHMACHPEVLGAATLHQKLWSEVSDVRPLHRIPNEQMKRLSIKEFF